MSDSSTPDKSKPAGFKLSTEVIVALISVVGVVIVAVFGYLQSRVPYEFSRKVTQTAEARLTRIALSITPTEALLTKTPTTTVTKHRSRHELLRSRRQSLVVLKVCAIASMLFL